MQQSFVLEEFPMLSTAKCQWNELLIAQKEVFDRPIRDWIYRGVKPSIKSLAFLKGKLHFVEFEGGSFLLIFIGSAAQLVLVDFGHVDQFLS